MNLNNKIKIGLFSLLTAGSFFLTACDDGFVEKKADYIFQKKNTQSLDSIPSNRILKSIDNYVGSADSFIAQINAPNPEIYTFEQIEDFNEYIIESWDSVAQNQYDAINLSNYLQERAKKENELNRFSSQKIDALENVALKAYDKVLALPFNPLNQQVKQGQSLDISYWDASQNMVNATNLIFEDDAILGHYSNKILFFPPEPRFYVAEYSSQFSGAKLRSEFDYDARNKMTIGDVLLLMEKNVKQQR